MLELKEIKKKYTTGETEQQVLKGIDIKFRTNEFTSILGASGSGKTTLLNIIGGLDKYDSGELIVDGVSTSKYSDRDWDSYRNYRVGFIFQNYNLITHQSVLSNVEMALTLSGIGKKQRRKRAIQALEKVGLKEHINKNPNQLSGGQMQRVAIARALVNNPEIILADEPTGALDSDTSIQIMDLLKEISKEKLVIMVTHNPEIAKKYSTRIIELKDGIILNDSNPCTADEQKMQEREVTKTSMSLITSLGLSFKNLLTKKGRTFLTSFAGSIGIVGIALILSLSNGVSNYVSNIERNSLSDYPISFEKNTYDYSKVAKSNVKEEKIGKEGQLESEDDITTQLNIFEEGFIKENNLKELKKYLESKEEIKDYVTEIKYVYDLDLQIYSNKNDKYVKVNPNDFNVLENVQTSKVGFELSGTSDDSSSNFVEIQDDEEVLNSKYTLIAGKMPSEYNEVVLIVNSNNTIPDSLLYALNIKDRDKLKDIVEKAKNDKNTNIESTIYSYDDILKLSYKLVLNTDYYQKENSVYKDYSKDMDYLKEIVDNGLDIKIVGILRAKGDAKSNVIGYKHSLTEYVIKNISKTEIYKEQTKNKDINVFTNEKFDGLVNTYENNCKILGIADIENPSSICIYPKDFDSKNKIVSLINEYNKEQREKGRDDLVVEYTDLIKTVASGVTSIINMVSAVLIGFVAISLIVSSIMIAIITYISVLERTKEIGILRAIGASKKDISRVFKAETIIEGSFAGILGISLALLICIPVNLIASAKLGVDNIAKMPLASALLLILLSILLNVIAGHIPSKMASKKDPVVALRSE